MATRVLWAQEEIWFLLDFYNEHPYVKGMEKWTELPSFLELQKRINDYNKLLGRERKVNGKMGPLRREAGTIDLHLVSVSGYAGHSTKPYLKKWPAMEKEYKRWKNDKDRLKVVCETIEYHIKQAKGKKSGKKPKKIIYDEGISPSDDELTKADEGKALRGIYYKKERVASLKKKRVKWFEQNNRGKLKCENCNFNFKKAYKKQSPSSNGKPHGEGYIESHHRVPLSVTGPVATNWKKDLILLCSNCHRMVHRSKKLFLTIDELKKITTHKFK